MVATHEELVKLFASMQDIPRPWLKAQPENSQHILPEEIKDLRALFNYICQQHKDKPAYHFMQHSISYHELHTKAITIAKFMQQQLNLSPKACVGIMLPNSLHYPVSFWATIMAGYRVVNINPLSTPQELGKVIKDAHIELIIVLENHLPSVKAISNDCQLKNILVANIGDFMGTLTRIGIKAWLLFKGMRQSIPRGKVYIKFRKACNFISQAQLSNPPIDSMCEPALIQYTGGTSGQPKGVILTHHNIISNAKQIKQLLDYKIGANPQVVLGALPFYHIYALMLNLLAFALHGSSTLIILDPRQQNKLITTLQKNPINIFIGINSLFKSLLENPSFMQIDFKSWQFTMTGGMTMQKSVNLDWRAATNTQVIQGYGLTEASPVVTINLSQEEQLIRSIGIPLANTDVIIIKTNKAEICNSDEAGELCVRGPQVMQGYWRRPEKTAMNLINGWLLTGDIAKMDADGNLFIVDRKKDMLIVSGFNVYPAEIEEVLERHPMVLDAAVIGVPDDKTGEAVKAFVVRQKSGCVTVDEIIAHCQENLLQYKIPKEVVFISEIPKSQVGKVMRRMLHSK